MLSLSFTSAPKSFSELLSVHSPPQPIFVLGIAPTHVQDLALGLVEFQEVHTGLSVQVPLDGIPSLQCVDCTTQLGVIGKLAEGVLSSTVHVADKNVEQRQSQYRPLRNVTGLHLDVEPLTTTLSVHPDRQSDEVWTVRLTGDWLNCWRARSNQRQPLVVYSGITTGASTVWHLR